MNSYYILFKVELNLLDIFLIKYNYFTLAKCAEDVIGQRRVKKMKNFKLKIYLTLNIQNRRIHLSPRSWRTSKTLRIGLRQRVSRKIVSLRNQFLRI
jgi:hypothetical protein